eukprot:Phypoly_transcript_08157.p1 GENE.Phypoly_transcript_08157~~Phypoly_transcript_08157.p1  ORF type:complete len:466 (+),score=115.76 Phypoly_transcript_08157:163-1398(+)
MALHNYNTQKCVEFLFSEHLKQPDNKHSNNTNNNNNNNNNNINNNSNNNNNNNDHNDNNKDNNNNNNNNNNNDNYDNNNTNSNNTSPNNYDNDIEMEHDKSEDNKPEYRNNETTTTTTSTTTSQTTNSQITNHETTNPEITYDQKNKNETTYDTANDDETLGNNQTTKNETTTSTTTTATSAPSDLEIIDGDSIQCKICLETKKIDFMFVMQQCGHGFCRECVSGYFTSKINDRVSPIKCPNYQCKKEATEFDLEMVLDRKMLDKFADNSFQNAIRKNPQQFSCCPTPDCPYIFFYTPSDSPDFGCPTCKKRYCLKCRVTYHAGSTCEAYQKWSVENGMSDDLFRDFVQGHKFKQCPQCMHWVEKTEGCDHMTCICAHEFCYRCGGDYGEGCECADREYDEDEGEDEDEYY